MDNKEFFDHYSGLRIAEDGEAIWTTTYKTGHQHTFRTYGYDIGDGHRAVDYKGKRYRVHILVAECFLNDGKQIPAGYDVHHINEVKDDNRVENLIILTHSEHKRLHMKGKPKSEETKRKLSEALKKPIIGTNIKTDEVFEFESGKDAARVLNISQGHISSCLTGRYKSTGGWRFEYKIA